MRLTKFLETVTMHMVIRQERSISWEVIVWVIVREEFA